MQETKYQPEYIPQNAEGEHKEKATYVPDLIKGLIYMNRFLISMFPSLVIFVTVLSVSIIIL